MTGNSQRLMAGLCAASLLALAACSSSTNAKNSSGRKQVKVALVAPLTSGNSTFATQMKNSAELAAKQYNESSTGKCTLSISAYDDKGTAEDATKVIQRAISADGAKVIVGGYAGVEALATKELAERQNIVYLSTSTLSPALTQDAKYTFRVSARLLDYPNTYAAFIKRLGFHAPAIVADDSPTGKPLVQPLNAALAAVGVRPAGSAVIFPANSTDLTATVQQAKSQHPDAVIVLGAVAADQGLIVKTASEQGLKAPLMGNSAIASPDAQKVGGGAYKTMTVYTFNNTDPAKPEYADYVSKYTAKYGQQKSLTEAADQTYDATLLLGAALDQDSCNPTGSKLATAIHALPPQPAAAGSTGTKLNFSAGQDGFKDVQLVAFKVVDGALRPAI